MLPNRVVARRGRGSIVAVVCGAFLIVCALLHTSRSALQGHIRNAREAAAVSIGIQRQRSNAVTRFPKEDEGAIQHKLKKSGLLTQAQQTLKAAAAPQSYSAQHASDLGVQLLAGEPWYTLSKSSGTSKRTAQVRLPLILHSSNFPAVVRHHVDPMSGAVAISTFRGGIKPLELAFAMNQYVQFAGVGLVTNLMVICTTHATAVNAWRHNVPLYLNNLTVRGRLASPDPIITKWFLAAQVARLGHAVLFVDFDLGLRCNPYTLFKPAESGVDIEILWDKYYIDTDFATCTNGVVSIVAGKQFESHCASTGFWFVHSHDLATGARLAPFLQAMYDQSLTQWEQIAFNIMAPEWDTVTASQKRTHSVKEDRKVDHLKLVMLTHPSFVNIINLPRLKKLFAVNELDVCLLHCGAINNGEPKAAALEQLGLFRPHMFRNSSKGNVVGGLAHAIGAVQLEGYGTEVAIPYFDPSRLDTIWL